MQYIKLFLGLYKVSSAYASASYLQECIDSKHVKFTNTSNSFVTPEENPRTPLKKCVCC